MAGRRQITEAKLVAELDACPCYLEQGSDDGRDELSLFGWPEPSIAKRRTAFLVGTGSITEI